MRRLDLADPDPCLLSEAARIIRGGGIVLHPTDTIYGLGCDPFQEDSLRRLVALKGRPEEKGLLVLVPDLESLGRLADGVSPAVRRFLRFVWPGPVTVLLGAKRGLSPLLTGGGGKIGIRLPEANFLRLWLDKIGGPVVSTSANRSGEAYRGDAGSLQEISSKGVDLFLDAGPLPGKTPSTVVDLSEAEFRIVREGAGLERVRAAVD